MKNLWKILIVYLITSSCVMASDVFNHPSSAKNIMASIPDFRNVHCAFTQTKTIPNSPAVLKSGGDFVFDKNKGVVFYTKYPVKMTTAYTKNEQVNKIINDVINKKYASLEKNFNFYFVNNSVWELGLVPKNPQMKRYVKSLYISGKTDIHTIEIRNVDGTVTRINFKVG